MTLAQAGDMLFLLNMRTVYLNPNQIITLNDYPVHSDEVLSKYFNKCKLDEETPLVPVIEKEIVRKSLDGELLTKFEEFEKQNTEAAYFMLDGSHRTTALTLCGHGIQSVILETNEDIVEAKSGIVTGRILKNGILDCSLEENCKILNDHFKEKPYFMTVEQKTEKMVNEKVIPQYMIDSYNEKRK
jgi:hypothetical protein